jgi:hypothetical protein
VRKLAAVVIGNVAALVAFAGAASSSATIDLIWIDVTNVDSNGQPICLDRLNRNCPQLGTTLSNVATSETITLGVIVTAGPAGVIGAGVNVNYGDALPTFSVAGFQSLVTWSQGQHWLVRYFGVTSDLPPVIDNINATSVQPFSAGIGLPPGQTAYLGTVSFHMDQIASGTLEFAVGASGPGGTDGVGNQAYENITSTTTFNSAFVVPEPNALTALSSGIAMLSLLHQRRQNSAAR